MTALVVDILTIGLVIGIVVGAIYFHVSEDKPDEKDEHDSDRGI